MIFFDKWKELHGYDKKIEPDYPDILWFMEELLIEPILNDARIQKVIPIKHSAYDSLKEIEIQGKSLTNHIQVLYDNRKGMEDFLEETYSFLLRNHVFEIS